MSNQVETSFTHQYSNTLTMLVQQKGSRLRSAVRTETIRGESAFFDQIGATSVQKVLTHHADSPLIDTPHERRQVYVESFVSGDIIDSQDKVKMLIDPSSEYLIARAHAMGRQIDQLILNAANGSARTGKTGATITALPSAQKVLHNNTGLTFDKLLEAKEKLDAAENDPDEPRYIALKASDITALLKVDKITSADYNSVYALVKGEVNSFLNFNFIRTELVSETVPSGATRAVIAWRKSALLAAFGQDPTAKRGPRPDKMFADYLQYMMTVGATRMEEAGVVEIGIA